MAISFSDAATNGPVTATVHAVVRDAAGELSTVTQDREGAPGATFTAVNGTVLFQVDPSAPLPQVLTVVATAEGYNATSYRVNVDADEGHQGSAPMVSLANPPAGVSATQAALGSADAGGLTAATVAVSTAPEATTGGSATLALPAATRLTTRDGAPLSGALSLAMTYYNGVDATSLAAFPGGLDAAVPPTPGAAPVEGSFVSAGFVALEIEDPSGKCAASFSQPVSVTIPVAPGTIDPTTGAPVQSGDDIPLWSYDEEKGRWQPEGAVRVRQGAAGLEATGSISHLSYYNLGWFLPGSTCASGSAGVVISGNPGGLPLDLTITGTGYSKTLTGVTDAVNTLLNPPAIAVDITASYQGRKVGTAKAGNLCGASVNLAVSIQNVTPASLTVTVARQCIEDATSITVLGSVPVTVASAPDALGYTWTLASAFTTNKGDVLFKTLPAGTPLRVTTTVPGAAAADTVKTATLAAGANRLDFRIPVQCVLTGGAGGTP